MALNGRVVNNAGFVPMMYNPILNNNIMPNNILLANPAYSNQASSILGANSNIPSMNVRPIAPMLNMGPLMNPNGQLIGNPAPMANTYLNNLGQVNLVPENVNILKPLSIPMDPIAQINNDITTQFLQNKLNSHNLNTKFNMALHFKNEKYKDSPPLLDVNSLDLQIKNINSLTKPQLTKRKIYSIIIILVYNDLKIQEASLVKEDETLANKNKDYTKQVNVILDSQKKEIDAIGQDLKKLTIKVDDNERKLINQEIEDEFGKAMEGYLTFKVKHPHLNKIDPKDYMDISNMIHMELANKNFYLKIDDY